MQTTIQETDINFDIKGHIEEYEPVILHEYWIKTGSVNTRPYQVHEKMKLPSLKTAREYIKRIHKTRQDQNWRYLIEGAYVSH